MKKYNISGIHCAACAGTIEKVALATEGVTFAAVNVILKTLTVEGSFDEAALIKALSRRGYKAISDSPVTSDNPATSDSFITSASPATSANLVTSDKLVTSDSLVTSDKLATSANSATFDNFATSDNPTPSDKLAVSYNPIPADKLATSANPTSADKLTSSDNFATSDSPTTSDSLTTSFSHTTSDSPTISASLATSFSHTTSDSPTTPDSPTASNGLATSDAPTASGVLSSCNKITKKSSLMRSNFVCEEKLSTLIANLFAMVGIILLHTAHGGVVAINVTFQAILATVVIVLNRKRFVSGALAALGGAANMDSLVSLGAAVAYIWSVYIVARIIFLSIDAAGGEVLIHTSAEAVALAHQAHFGSVAMILTFVSVGKLLEERSKAMTTKGLESLVELVAPNAVVVRDGYETTIDAGDVKVGDILSIRAGELFATDGEVVAVTEEGALADESVMTGESKGVAKTLGSAVTGGTTLLSGALHYRATSVGRDTLLGRMIDMVEQATTSKAPVQRLCDKLAAIFTPAVLIISILTFITYKALGAPIILCLTRAIATLVVSCPCALGLATPAAVMTASGAAAKHGVLFKNATAIETLAKVTLIALDKTGTLTKGVVGQDTLKTDSAKAIRALETLGVECVMISGDGEEETAKIAKAAGIKKYFFRVTPTQKAKIVRMLQMQSVAKKTSGASDEKLGEEAFCGAGKSGDGKATGGGIFDSASINSKGRVMGERVFDSAEESGANKVAGEGAFGGAGEGKSASEEAFCGTGKSGAGEATGANTLGDELGDLKSAHKTVAMTGDGVNDSVALTVADVGISMASGKDIARDNSDVILMNNSLWDLYYAVRLAKKTFRVIKQNLFWAAIYNVLCIPLAAGALSHWGLVMNPGIGALCMSFSSLFVVTNALRIGRGKGKV